MSATILTQDELKQLLSYDPKTGVFTRIRSHRRPDLVGKETGWLDGSGYLRITIKGKIHKAHRLAWLYIYGKWPKDQIDHINHQGTDNRISNLREATSSENQRNTRRRKDNTSGTTGVGYHKTSRRWRARSGRNGETWIGCFKTKGEAIKARKACRGFHPNHGT